jgi:hypothetical protein
MLLIALHCFLIPSFFASVLIYFLLSSKDMEKCGTNYAENFALIFFILCGVVPGFRLLNHY